MKLEILKDSENYTCQVINLPAKQVVKGLDNLVKVTYQGNDCLISKDSPENELYLFFPVECQISDIFLKSNNLYRHSEKNSNSKEKGFFEDSGRVKAIKFKGVTSTGFICSLGFLHNMEIRTKTWRNDFLKVGQEFNIIEGVEICKKYRKKFVQRDPKVKQSKLIDEVIDSKMAPEHMNTEHLLKNIHNIDLDDYVAITYKLHGTSGRYFNTLVKRGLKWYEKLARWFGVAVQAEEYKLVCASRRAIKSVDRKQLSNKNHYFKSGDLWSEVGEKYLEGKLNKGEAIYCEIIGRTFSGEEIQKGYTYGFDTPMVFIYRISNINSQGIEIDLPYYQMRERAAQLGLITCPELFYGTLRKFLEVYTKPGELGIVEDNLNDIFYNQLLEKSSILDESVIEEGFCIRIDKYPKPKIYKIKSRAFLLHEGKQLDKEVVDMEEEQNII